MTVPVMTTTNYGDTTLSDAEVQLSKRVGKGAMAEVRAARLLHPSHACTSHYTVPDSFVVKMAHDNTSALCAIEHEWMCLQLANSQNIVRAYGRFNGAYKGVQRKGIILERANIDLDLLLYKWKHEGTFEAVCMSKIDRVLMLKHISNALASLHSKGYAHLDLKPGNVLIFNDAVDKSQPGKHSSQPDRIFNRSASPESNHEQQQAPVFKLSDLGCARRIGSVKPFETTWAYAAPEVVLSDDVPASPKMDIYSLGCLALQVLAMQPPMILEDREEHAALLRRRGELEPTDVAYPLKLPATENRLLKIVRKCLAYDPSSRPTAIELTQECDELYTRLVQLPCDSSVPHSWGDLKISDKETLEVVHCMESSVPIHSNGTNLFDMDTLKYTQQKNWPLAGYRSVMQDGCDMNCDTSAEAIELGCSVSPSKKGSSIDDHLPLNDSGELISATKSRSGSEIAGAGHRRVRKKSILDTICCTASKTVE